MAARFQYVQRANDVYLTIAAGVLQRSGYPRLRSQVYHTLHPCDCLDHGPRVQDGPFHNLQIQAGQVLSPARTKVVQHPHLVVLVQQHAHQVGSNEAGPASYQYSQYSRFLKGTLTFVAYHPSGCRG